MSKIQSYTISQQLTNSRSCTRKSRKKLWKKFEKQINKDKKHNSTVRNLSNNLQNYKNIEDRMNVLLEIIEQAESFLAKHKNEQQIKSDSSIVFHEISTTALMQWNITKYNIKKKNLHNKTLSANQDDFENILKYIKSLECKLGITLKVLNNNTFTNTTTHTLQKIKQTIKILSKRIKAYFQDHYLGSRRTAYKDTNPSTSITFANAKLTSITHYSYNRDIPFR
jgi:hypothetical protein